MKTSKLLIKGILTAAMMTSPLTAMAAGITIEKDTKLVNDLVEKLGTPVAVSKKLTDENQLKKLSVPARVSFSTSLRRYLNENSIALANDEKYNVPITFNPSWSPEKAKALKMERKNYICKQMMDKMNIDNLMHDLKIEAEKVKKQSVAVPLSTVAQEENQVILGELNRTIEALSKDEKNISVSQKLGQVISADVVNDSISELHLSVDRKNLTDLNSISLSLPMLIGFENMRDYYFVDSVACLSRLLMIEQNVLSYRKLELADPKRAQSTIDYMNNLHEAYTAYSAQARKENKAPASMDTFVKSQLNERADRDDVAMYLLKKDTFLPKIAAGQSEVEVLNARLTDLNTIIPFVQLKLKGSEFAHKQLIKLSKKQVRELITLLLELQRNNIPTDKSLAKIMKLGQENEKYAGDAVYYKNMNESLDELLMGIYQPK